MDWIFVGFELLWQKSYEETVGSRGGVRSFIRLKQPTRGRAAPRAGCESGGKNGDRATWDPATARTRRVALHHVPGDVISILSHCNFLPSVKEI